MRNWKQNGEILMLYIGYLGWKALILKVTSLMKSRQFYVLVASTVGTTAEKQGSNSNFLIIIYRASMYNPPSSVFVIQVAERCITLWPSDRTHVGWFIQHYPAFIGGDFNWMSRATCNLGMDKVYSAQRPFAKGASGSAPIQIDFHPARKKRKKRKPGKLEHYGCSVFPITYRTVQQTDTFSNSQDGLLLRCCGPLTRRPRLI